METSFLRNLHTGLTNLHFQSSVGGFLYQTDSQKKKWTKSQKGELFSTSLNFSPTFLYMTLMPFKFHSNHI